MRSLALLSVCVLLLQGGEAGDEVAPPWPAAIAAERTAAAGAPEHLPTLRAGRAALAGAAIDDAGARISTERGEARIGLAAYGRAGAMRDASRGAPTLAGPEVRIARGPGVTEWWRSLPSGLEQGVTIEERLDGSGELVLEMSLGPSIVAVGTTHGDVELRDARTSRPLARYAQLVVLDAHGVLPSRMVGDGDRIRISIDDTRASYPLVVDPIVITEEFRLRGSSFSGGTSIGVDVAVDRAGTRFVATTNTTGVYVFARAGSTWANETPTGLCGCGPARVAISGDGTRVLVVERGAFWVFVRSGTAWTMELRLARSGTDAGFADGAIDETGTRLFVGTAGVESTAFPYPPSPLYVYLRTGTSWAIEATIPDPVLRAGTGDREFMGEHIDVDGDGSVLVVGNPEPHTGARGEAYVFRRAGAAWALEATFPSPDVLADVAVSADGAHVLLSTREAFSVATLVEYGVAGSSWTESARFSLAVGRSADVVALDGSGMRALVAGRGASDGGLLYSRGASTWMLEGPLPGGAPRGADIAATGAVAVVGATVTSSSELGVIVSRLGGSLGLTCAADDACGSGFCVEGVCCDGRCGGGDDGDCEACSVAHGGSTDGTCTALTATAAPAVTCRPPLDLCDAPEVCSPTSRACPVDGVRTGTSTCRARVPGSLCDAVERCDGISIVCPPDEAEPVGTTCGGAGTCTAEARCDGTSRLCPSAGFLGPDVVCQPRALDGTGSPLPCDVDDHCSGTSADCPATFAPSTTVCAPSTGTICDAPDTCSGTSADCVPSFLSGVECRRSTGACDPAEVCNGTLLDCPPDQVLPAESVCRASADLGCDPLEACDGFAAACPLDVNRCDATDGGPTDASSGADAAGPPPTAATCACHVGGSRTGALVWLLLAAAHVVRRRRR